jgi:transposase
MNECSRRFFDSLSEKDRRRFAAVEADRLGRHGVREVSEFYGIHPKTIREGKRELVEGLSDLPDRIRKPGGGRKPAESQYAEIDDAFLDVLDQHTAGNPMDGEVRWTHLGDEEIREQLQTRGYQVDIPAVKRLLNKHHYHRRQAAKKKTFKHDPDRNTQFEIIEAVNEAEAAGVNPILSIDTKKKSTSVPSTGVDRSM